MIKFISTLLAKCRESIKPTRNTSLHPKKAERSLQDLILAACRGKDISRMQTLLDEWHEVLVRQVAKSGSVEILQLLLDQYSTTTVLNQSMLEEAALHGNTDVFRFLLQQQPEPVISDKVRSNALEGGIEVWKVILDRQPELINYDFGEIGDLLAMATLMNNVPLLEFFLAKGLDPNNSCFLLQPIIDVASSFPSIKPEILDLLTRYRLTDKDYATNLHKAPHGAHTNGILRSRSDIALLKKKSLVKRGNCFSSKKDGTWTCSSETPSVEECISKIRSHGQVGSKISVFYSGLGGAQGLIACKQYFSCHPEIGDVVLWDNIVDPDWITAQGQAMVQGNPGPNLGIIVDPFLKRMSQAFAEATKGDTYVCTPEDNAPDNDFNQDLAWGGWEYPALTRNRDVTKVVRLDPTMSVTREIWKQGDPETPNAPKG